MVFFNETEWETHQKDKTLCFSSSKERGWFFFYLLFCPLYRDSWKPSKKNNRGRGRSLLILNYFKCLIFYSGNIMFVRDLLFDLKVFGEIELWLTEFRKKSEFLKEFYLDRVFFNSLIQTVTKMQRLLFAKQTGAY